MTEMLDMSQFVEAKSDQLNADDLIGAPRTIIVRKVTGCDGDQPVAVFYEGDNNKPFKPCKTMRRVLMAVWGRNAGEYVGRSMTLYRDDSVTFGGLNVGGIRISHVSNIDKEVVVVAMKSKGKKAPIRILPLASEPKPAANKRQTAAEWAQEHIAQVDACTLFTALDALILRGIKPMEKLAADNIELHQLVSQAYEGRRVSLAGEGRTETDMGDGFAA